MAFSTEAESLESSFRYAVIGSLASILILLGIGLLYSYTGSLNMDDIGRFLFSKPRGLLIGFVSVLFIAGFGVKAAVMPFHAWLADAHSSAPAPVSAVLSGIFIKTLGIYALVRIFFNCIGVTQVVLSILMALGLLSLVVAGFLATGQNDIKRMLAYSSVSQIGYIVFAFGIGTPLAIVGGLFHLLSHAFAKSLLFLDAGAIEYSTGSRDIRKLGGLNQKLPITARTSFIGSLSISGIPPLSGAWSKLIIIIAAFQAGYFFAATVAALASIITLIYYFRYQTMVFFGQLQEWLNDCKEIPVSMRIALVTLAFLCIAAALVVFPAFRYIVKDAGAVVSAGVHIRF